MIDIFRKKKRKAKLTTAQKLNIIRGLRINYGYDSRQINEILKKRNHDLSGSEPVNGV